jgi:hypothetical protein
MRTTTTTTTTKTTTITRSIDPAEEPAEMQGYAYAPGTQSTTLPFNPFGPRPSGFPPAVLTHPL